MAHGTKMKEVYSLGLPHLGPLFLLTRLSLLYLLLLPTLSHAQHEPEKDLAAEAELPATDNTSVEAAEKKAKHKLTMLPVPIVDPTIGNGLAGVALYTFPSPGADDNGPRSTLALGAAYTDTKTYAVGAGGSVHLRNDNIRLTGSAAIANANISYYGVGGNSPLAENPVPLNVEGWFINVAAKIRVADHFYVGGAVKVLDGTLTVERQIQELPDSTASYRQLALGPIVEYDSRDNSWWPTKGSSITAQYLYYSDSEPVFAAPPGVGGNFWKLDAKASTYLSINQDFVVAAQARMASAENGAPFFLLPSISLRGFPGGRYLDSFVLQSQVEARWKFGRRFGLVAFGGLGLIAPSLSEMDRGETAVGYGVGARYLISPADRMNIGIDVAFGGGGTAVYFRVGEAF